MKNNLLINSINDAAELINPMGKAAIVLICEHASNVIPASLNNLGLRSEDRVSHIAWDIGAYEMAIKMSELLDAPLIASKVSRLVYDCNRAPELGIGIPAVSESIEIPGNKDLSEDDINDRVEHVYKPFHDLINQTIVDPKRLRLSEKHAQPAIVTLHSFTPVYLGEERSVELGILHDKDDRLAKSFMQSINKNHNLKAQFNAPYDASDNVMHTINKHSKDGSFLNVMIEVKNDLLLNAMNINSVANDLSNALKDALQIE